MQLFGVCVILMIAGNVDGIIFDSVKDYLNYNNNYNNNSNSNSYSYSNANDNSKDDELDKSNKLMGVVIKPTRFFLVSKNKLESQIWKKILRINQFKKNQIIPTDKNISKKSLMSVGFHEGPSYHMELHPSGVPISKCVHYVKIQPANKERRNKVFNAWGGKRNSIPFKVDPKIRRPSRMPFNSWGGKRQVDYYQDDNTEDLNKKGINVADSGVKKPFNSWGGKRSLGDYYHLYSSDKPV